MYVLIDLRIGGGETDSLKALLQHVPPHVQQSIMQSLFTADARSGATATSSGLDITYLRRNTGPRTIPCDGNALFQLPPPPQAVATLPPPLQFDKGRNEDTPEYQRDLAAMPSIMDTTAESTPLAVASRDAMLVSVADLIVPAAANVGAVMHVPASEVSIVPATPVFDPVKEMEYHMVSAYNLRAGSKKTSPREDDATCDGDGGSTGDGEKMVDAYAVGVGGGVGKGGRGKGGKGTGRGGKGKGRGGKGTSCGTDKVVAAKPKVAKRPASHVDVPQWLDRHMEEVFKKLRSEKGPISKGCFTSRAYDSCKRQGTAKGVDDVTDIAKVYYAKASALYDALGLHK